MNTPPPRLPKATPTGKLYSGVEDLLRQLEVDQAVIELFAKSKQETQLADCLVEMRRRAGMSQRDIADKLGVTQSAISKWESSTDEELSVRIIRDYARTTKRHLMVCFGPRLNHVEAVKRHAFEMKRHLSELAALARSDEDLQAGIEKFFGEALYNILDILARCSQKVATGNDTGIRPQLVQTHATQQPKRDQEGEPACV